MKSNLIGVDDYVKCEKLGDLVDLNFLLKGRWRVEHFRRRKSGKLRKTNDLWFDNGITNVGKDLILNVMFNGGTQVANNSWFIGLIDNSGFSALAAADTMASHAGWSEFTAYSESTRQGWGSVTSTSQSTGNTTPASFSINATGTVYGIFVVSNSTKSGTTGTLWSTAGFSSTVAVANGDSLRCTYTLSC